MRSLILAIAVLGAVFFAGAFAMSWIDPLLVERGAREVLRIEVERRVGERLGELSGSRISQLAQRALRRTGVEVGEAERGIREQLPRKVANVVADMLDADCACRRRLVALSEESALARVATLRGVQEKLVHLIEGAYASVSRSLLREFRIFTASNAVAFALLGLTTLWRRKAAMQLLLPALVLVGAVAIAGGIYLFGQDWLHTIVFGDYVGWGYSLYLASVAAFLADIVFNRARVSTHLVNAAGSAVGSAVTALPC